MVKKIKRFIVFVLFSFLYSLLSSKASEAATVCLVPQTANGKLKYNNASVEGMDASTMADAICS